MKVGEQSMRYLKERVNIDRLKIQQTMLPDGIWSASSDTTVPGKITTMRTVVDALSESESVQNMLGEHEADKLLRLCLTVPVSSATPERSFSSPRLIKMFLRSMMTQERLNNPFML